MQKPNSQKVEDFIFLLVSFILTAVLAFLFLTG